MTAVRLKNRLPAFPRLLGMELTATELDRVAGTLEVREEVTNGTGAIHGGALMSFADTLGAILKYQDDIQKIQGSEAKKLLDEVKKGLVFA